MKRFTLRLDDDLHKKFKELCGEEGKSMKAKLVEMIKQELDDRKVAFDVGQLIYLHRAAGLPLPAELKELKDKIYDKEATETNKLAQELIQRKEKGEDLTEAEQDFLNSWLEDQTVGISAEVGKPEGLKDE